MHMDGVILNFIIRSFFLTKRDENVFGMFILFIMLILKYVKDPKNQTSERAV